MADPSGMFTRFQTKPNLNATDVRGKTALMYACACGHLDVTQYLITKHKVDVNLMNDTQKTAFHHAVKKAKLKRDDVSQADIV